MTHNWENGNHEKVSRINDALKRRGLITWFDSERMNDQIHPMMGEALAKTASLVIFLTKIYEEKINDGNEADNCYFEFNAVSCDQMLVNKRIVAATEKDMANPLNWKPGRRISRELGTYLILDVSEDDDETIFERQMDELAKRIIEKIETPLIPAGESPIEKRISTPLPIASTPQSTVNTDLVSIQEPIVKIDNSVREGVILIADEFISDEASSVDTQVNIFQCEGKFPFIREEKIIDKQTKKVITTRRMLANCCSFYLPDGETTESLQKKLNDSSILIDAQGGWHRIIFGIDSNPIHALPVMLQKLKSEFPLCTPEPEFLVLEDFDSGKDVQR